MQRRLPQLSSSLALAEVEAPRKSCHFLLVFLFLIEILVIIHLPLLGLPFFWDEQGQFIPTALDLLRNGSWIPHSTTPNVHPPGIAAYLVLWYKLFGFSITVSRVAMLLLACLGLFVTFLLALELTENSGMAPGFLASLLLLASPLFYTQSILTQLDMPAMLFTLLALLLFFKHKYAAASIACIALVLVKETGLVVPAVLGAVLLFRRDWRHAPYFIAPALVLLAWLIFLHRSTGYWLGSPEFANYNVKYSLNPVRVAVSFARRIYYLFFAEFRWIGTLLLLLTAKQCKAFKKDAWNITMAVAFAHVIVVSVFGGAELERYLLPLLPLFYIAVGIALTCVPRSVRVPVTAAFVTGLVANLFWNPPYPFPYENNYAMVDFVRLQQVAAAFAERNLSSHTIATAWPYSAALTSSDYGFVEHKLKVIETNDFHFESIRALPAKSFDVLIEYTRTWAPQYGVIRLPIVRWFLSRYYEFQPEITGDQCQSLGLDELKRWERRGQEITIYVRRKTEAEAALIVTSQASPNGFQIQNEATNRTAGFNLICTCNDLGFDVGPTNHHRPPIWID